jgi:hypothetical protein|tara:strand:- start:151 stop:294 length:144 start_codon:yes stop_codon:yes gene_type:complete
MKMSADSETQRHQTDWENFISLMKYSLTAIGITLILMATFLTERTPG